jgi:hypothetical protein
MVAFPAFKEWQAVVGTLEAGEQVLILRKGGIAEGREGFVVRASRFWLFPTAFHAQLTKIKPGAHRHFASEDNASTGSVVLSSYADVVESRFLADWQTVARLDAHHVWTEQTIKDRFNGSRPAGVHALVVRVFRLRRPLTLPLTAGMAGCRSWINLPASFDEQQADPVLDDVAFALRLTRLREVLDARH